MNKKFGGKPLYNFKRQMQIGFSVVNTRMGQSCKWEICKHVFSLLFRRRLRSWISDRSFSSIRLHSLHLHVYKSCSTLHLVPGDEPNWWATGCGPHAVPILFYKTKFITHHNLGKEYFYFVFSTESRSIIYVFFDE